MYWLFATYHWGTKSIAKMTGTRESFHSRNSNLIDTTKLFKPYTHYKPLHIVSVTKYLGVYIDQCLTWQTHVDSILSYKMYCIKCLRWISLRILIWFVVPGFYLVFV